MSSASLSESWTYLLVTLTDLVIALTWHSLLPNSSRFFSKVLNIMPWTHRLSNHNTPTDETLFGHWNSWVQQKGYEKLLENP